MNPSRPSWPHTAADASVTSFTALGGKVEGGNKKELKRLPLSGLSVARERWRNIGDRLKALDLSLGKAACE